MISYKRTILSICCIMLITDLSVQAQNKNVKTAKKKKQNTELVHPSVNMQDMLPATAKLVFIDSIVVNQNNFISHIPLSKDCGEIMPCQKFMNNQTVKHPNSLAYVNNFNDKCFYSDSTTNGKLMLYTTDKLGGKWQKARLVKEFAEDYEDICYPYLMPDGVTLYFSAKSKTKSIGGRDIFVTRLNTDSMTFYKPENVGLPYNSVADDYCCIIDDLNSLGWLVTNRNQPKGKVCIYTFIPTTERWIDKNANIPQKKLETLAHISKISDTWTSKKDVDDAKKRLEELMKIKGNSTQSHKSHYLIINDKRICKSEDDLHSASSKKLYNERINLTVQQETDNKLLEQMRISYSKSDKENKKSISKTIIKLEKDCEKREKQIEIIEKKIRNAENLI